MNSSDDVFRWPDGTWCYRYEHPEMSHMSDDFEVIRLDTPEWITFHQENK